MKNILRYSAIAAALLAGSAASAQTVITTDQYVAPAPTYVAPPPTVIVPAPGIVVEDDGPIVEQRIVTPAPPIETETIVRPAPERRVIQRAPTTQVRLTTRQRHDVLRTVRTERPARVVTERVDYRVGAALPASVPVYAMPQQVVYEAPSLRGYEYTMIGDRMLVVEPGSNTVVDELY